MLKGVWRYPHLAGFMAMGCGVFPAGGYAEDASHYTIEQVGFLAGCWQGDSSSSLIRETYTTPRAGTMLGTSQLVSRGKTDFFEFIRIVQAADGIEYRPLPQGKVAASFRLVKAGAGEVIFENPANDFPQRIAYVLDAGRGVLTARIERLDGSKSESFPMKAVPCGGESHRKALR